jgi:hypothetical protein
LLAEKPLAVVGDAHVGVEAAADQRWSGLEWSIVCQQNWFFGPLINEAQPSTTIRWGPPGSLPWHTEGAEERLHSRSSPHSRATYVMDAGGAAPADAATNPSPAPAVVVDRGGISKLAYLAPFCCILSLSCVLSWPIRSISWIIFTSLVPLAYV